MDPRTRVYRKGAVGTASYMDPGVLLVLDAILFCLQLDLVDDDPTPFVEQALSTRFGSVTKSTAAADYVWIYDEELGVWVYVCIRPTTFEVSVDAGEPVVVVIEVIMQAP